LICAKKQVAYWVYNALATGLLLIGLLFLPVLYLLGKRYSMGLGERLGFYSREMRSAVKSSRPVWIHAASVGEILSAGGLAEEIKKRFPSQKILVSAFTYTGYLTARRVMSDSSVIFFPMDHPWIVKRAFFTFEPSLLVFLETEIWPNMLRLAHRRGIPTLLLSGRFSSRSVKKYSSLSWFFRAVLGNFTSMGMQSDEDADRAKRVGADPAKVFVTGNLKLAAWGDNCDHNPMISEPLHLKRKAEGRCLLVAGSSHRGEEEILLDAFRSVKQRFPNFQMVLAPRHPQRFPEVERLLKASGLEFEKKSQTNGRSFFMQDICFLDTLGDLKEFYALGDIAFVGGSLVDAGGHNLLEPARVRRPVLFGPYMANFAAMAAEMKEKGGGVEVRGVEDLVREITDLLNDADKRLTMGENAYQVAADEQRVGERTSELLSRYLQPL
jgi:3-deoxy-D-manno-octulosonic-acid transferase